MSDNEKDIWFSSDYHLGHANILKPDYDSRPFKTIEHMNEAIIANHNSLVDDDDDFYFLGDFSFNDKRTEEWLQRLNGNKFFIRGNHDRSRTVKLYNKYGTYLGDLWNGEIGNSGEVGRFTLCHYAMRTYPKAHRGAVHLYGHSHGSLPELKDQLSMDIGIMNNNYHPFNILDIYQHMQNKQFKPVDHHGRNNRRNDD